LLLFLKGKKVIPAKSFLLTFDDGFREISDFVKPILLKKGVPATFFLCNKFIDNNVLFHRHKASIIIEYLLDHPENDYIEQTEKVLLKYGIKSRSFKKSLLTLNHEQEYIIDEISEILRIDFDDYLLTKRPYISSSQVYDLINDGFTIGAHSVDHPRYSLLSLKEQLDQTKTSIELMCNRYKLNYKVFSFPFNDDLLFINNLKSIYNDKLEVDAFFGSSCMKKNSDSKYFQRIPMEGVSLSAEKMICIYYALKTLRKIYINHILNIK
jgi:peptidoglycan/xylan/chitin deacetylase (PgdA/CDA1 family)